MRRSSTAPRSGGWPSPVYLRLHGSPRMYYSEYSEDTLHHVAELLLARRATGGECWCVFDNTTLGAASGNALELARLVQRSG